MEIEISWFGLFKLFISGLLTYVVFPLVLVIRDMILWKVVDIFIINSALRTRISMYANDVWFLNNKYNKDTFAGKNSDGILSYSIDNTEVSKDEYDNYMNSYTFHDKRAEASNIYITRRHNIIVWLFKHYKQDKGSNPIPNMQEKAFKRVELRENNHNA